MTNQLTPKLLQTMRSGHVVASIWQGTDKYGERFTVTFERHRMEGNVRRVSVDFTASDLARLAVLSTKAMVAISALENSKSVPE